MFDFNNLQESEQVKILDFYHYLKQRLKKSSRKTGTNRKK